MSVCISRAILTSAIPLSVLSLDLLELFDDLICVSFVSVCSVCVRKMSCCYCSNYHLCEQFLVEWVCNWNAILQVAVLAQLKHSNIVAYLESIEGEYFLVSLPVILAQRAVYFVCVFSLLIFFSIGPISNAISEFTGLTFTKFSGLVDAWEGLINQLFIFWLLKGCCNGNQF